MNSFREYQNIISDMELQRKYLPHKYVVKKIALSWDIYQMKKNLDDVYRNSDEYFSLEESYLDIVYQIVDLFRDIGIDNPIVIFGVYNYLLKNGYLSFRHRFSYNTSAEDCYPLFGTNVIEGQGVCRHIATMLTDIYKEMGFDSYNVSTIYNKNISMLPGQRMTITNSTINRNFLEKCALFLSYPNYNHLITLVNDTLDGSIFLDPTNDTIFVVDDNNKIRSMLDNDIFIDCGIECVFNNDDGENIDKIISCTDKKMKNYYTFLYYQGINLGKELKDCFEMFYQDNRSLYSDVVRKKRNLVKEFHRYILKR